MLAKVAVILDLKRCVRFGELKIFSRVNLKVLFNLKTHCVTRIKMLLNDISWWFKATFFWTVFAKKLDLRTPSEIPKLSQSSTRFASEGFVSGSTLPKCLISLTHRFQKNLCLRWDKDMSEKENKLVWRLFPKGQNEKGKNESYRYFNLHTRFSLYCRSDEVPWVLGDLLTLNVPFTWTVCWCYDAAVWMKTASVPSLISPRSHLFLFELISVCTLLLVLALFLTPFIIYIY